MRKDIRENELVSSALNTLIRHANLAMVLITAALFGTASYHHLRPVYKAASSILLRSPDTSPILSATSKVTGYSLRDYGAAPLNQSYLKILNSQSLVSFISSSLKRDRNAFGPIAPEILNLSGISTTAEQFTEAEIEQLSEDIVGYSQFRGKDEDIIEIYASTTTPEGAYQVANFLNAVAVQYLYQYESKEVSDIERFLNQENQKMQARIQELTKEMEANRSELSKNGYQVGGTNPGLVKLKEELEIANFRLRENQTISAGLDSEIRRATANADSYGLRGRLIDRYNNLKDERVAIEAKASAIRERIQALNKEYNPTPEQKLAELAKKLETEHILYQELQRQMSSMNMYRISIENRVRPYTLATIALARHETSLPRKLMLSGFLALITLLFLLYLGNVINPTVSNRNDVQALGMLHLGSIPGIGTQASFWVRAANRLLGTSARLVNKQRERVAFEFLRNRLVNILNRRRGQCQSIAVLSAHPEDGKSFACANIALLLARMKLKILVVDFDIHKSSMADFFQSKEKEGLAEIITGERRFEDVIRESGTAGVHFLAAGRGPANIEALPSEHIQSLIDSFKPQYDVVLIDTPACMARPESLLVANECDLVIFVASSHKTKIRTVREILDGLSAEKTGNILGILNRHEEFLDSTYNSSHYNVYSVPERKNVAS